MLRLVVSMQCGIFPDRQLPAHGAFVQGDTAALWRLPGSAAASTPSDVRRFSPFWADRTKCASEQGRQNLHSGLNAGT